jgi:hypothetical protein
VSGPRAAATRLRLDGATATEVPDTAPAPSARRVRWPDQGGDLSTRVAFWVFAAYLAVAWLVLVFGFGSERWFFRDDWNFLADRDGGSLSGLFEPHGEHLSLLPIAIYRVMFNLFGLWFTPYLALVVTMHLTVVALLRAVMRRVGVGPWVATVTAGAFALYGTGEENIQWAFQIGFVGSILYGLVQLILADHPGPISRRDWLGLVAGGLAVLSSGVGPLMVVAVGGATLLRRGWRAALFHTVPLAVLYGIWYVIVEPRSSPFGQPPVEEIWAWVSTGGRAVFDGLGQYPVVAALLALLLVSGLALAWGRLSWARFRRLAALPLALLACSPLFFAVTSQGRWFFGAEFAESSRYVYIGTCLLLPALAVAADAYARRWVWSTPAVLVLVLIGVPGNIDAFGSSVFSPQYFLEQRETMLGIAHSEEIEQVPPWVKFEPNAFNGPGLTSGWLLDARRDGRVPEPGPLSPGRESQFPVKLGLAHVDAPFDGECVETSELTGLQLQQGERIAIRSDLAVSLALPEGEPTLPVRFSPRDGGEVLEVLLPELTVWIGPDFGATSYELCT